MLFHVIAWVYRFDKGLGMDLGDSFLPKIALFIALLSIYEALMLIHYRAHVSFLCQHIRCVCVFLFLSLWLHRHLCEECYVKLPFCRFFSLLLCSVGHPLTSGLWALCCWWYVIHWNFFVCPGSLLHPWMVVPGGFCLHFVYFLSLCWLFLNSPLRQRLMSWPGAGCWPRCRHVPERNLAPWPELNG